MPLGGLGLRGTPEPFLGPLLAQPPSVVGAAHAQARGWLGVLPLQLEAPVSVPDLRPACRAVQAAGLMD